MCLLCEVNHPRDAKEVTGRVKTTALPFFDNMGRDSIALVILSAFSLVSTITKTSFSLVIG